LIIAPLAQKRIEIVRELVPKAAVVGMLVNPNSPDAAPEIRDVESAARANNLQLRLINATTPAEIDQAFEVIAIQRPDALLVGGDPFYLVERQKIVRHVANAGLAAVYPIRDFTDAGGLISYGANIPSSYRQAGIYAGRILKGAKPADLPVVQPTTFELVINLKTARAMNFEVPPLLHARSDDVIE
jgi:putative ABC transport system substrate-binding protein